jgi:hypothetical protein
MKMKPYDFHRLRITNGKFGSKLVLSLHKNTLENDGSPEGDPDYFRHEMRAEI